MILRNSLSYRIGHWLQSLSKGPKLRTPKVNDTNYDGVLLPGIDFCIPSSCSANDFRRAVSEFVGQRVVRSEVDELNETLYYSIVTYAGEDWCHTRESVYKEHNFDGPDIAVMYNKIYNSFLIFQCRSNNF